MSTAEQQPTGGGIGRLSLATTTAIMVAAVTAFFFLFVALFFFYLRAKRYWGTIPVSAPARSQPEASSAAPGRRGLDAAAVEALPLVVLCAGDPNDGVECAVCLSELGEGDAACLLPRCGHAFHLECIDKWFCSHSTCPLCRAAAEVEEVKIACSGARLVLRNDPSILSPDFAERFQSCVLGDCASGGNLGSTEGSSNTSESSSDLAASLPTSRLSEEGTRPPTSQTLRTLRKLLTVGSKMAGASCSPQGFDIQRGCPTAAKTPSTS